MRILHTSDWHLGQTLYELQRTWEHERFLAWLLDTIGEARADALLVAGDVFDNANPSAEAQRIWYRFLADLRGRHPDLDVVVIGGNHDSADRLDAPRPLLVGGFDVHVVGGLPRCADRRIDVDRLLVPLRDARGEVAAWVAAVPFLRPADLLLATGEGDGLVAGVRAVYDEVFAAARERRRPGQALVAMGHLYMASGELSEMSERRIFSGYQHALPIDVFPEDVAYVALGHLHKPQRVGADRIRYAGSPIPLALGERTYRHQVCLVELEGERLARVESIPVPRAVEILRVPTSGALPPDALVEALRTLPERGDRPAHELPYLEVEALLAEPDPGLPSKVEAALEGKAARLVRLGRTRTGDEAALADRIIARMLGDLTPEEVFANRYRRLYDEDPPDELQAAFAELLELVHQGRAG